MNFYAFSGLLTFITSLGFGIFSWVKGTKRLNKIWAIFCFCVAIWGLGCFKFSSVPNTDQVFFWLRIGHVGVILMPAFFLYFILEFLELRKPKTLFSIYALGIFFSVINLTDAFNYTNLLIAHLRFVFNEFYVDSPPAQLYPIFLCYYFGTIIYAHYCAFKQYRNSNALKKNQMKYFLAATVLGFAGGATSFFMVFGIDIYPTLHITVPLYPVIMTYAIVNYKLMDIEIIIKKTLVFAGLSSFVVACFSIPLFLLPRFFAKSITEELQLWLLIAAGMVVAALVGPVNRILTHATDKFLFQKKHEMKVILKNLSKKVVTVLDLNQVGKTILSTLEEAFRLESGMMFIRDKKVEKYRLLEYFGLEPEEFANGVKKYFDQPTIDSYFANHRSTLMLDHLDAARLPEEVGGWLKAARARVCVPLLIDEDLTGILVLGKKKSDQEFSQEEIDFFPTIESQVSLAIRNARLIETVVEEREAKVAAEHLAKRVEFAGLIKHEIQNKLVHIEMPANAASTYCVPRLKKSFKEQSEELFLEMCDEVTQGSKKINFAANRIRIIAQTAKGGVDEKDESFQELDCKVIWEDAKKESGLLKQCDFESKMPDGFTVYGNYHALQRTFVNLITNAYDAMKDKDEPLIKLRCSYENMEGKQVAYFEVEDSGCGIPKEIQGKIFKDGFSTKPKPDAKDLISSGHGQGLAACKLYIEGIHNGKIWFESEVGKGTTFKFWVPMKGNDARNSGG